MEKRGRIKLHDLDEAMKDKVYNQLKPLITPLKNSKLSVTKTLSMDYDITIEVDKKDFFDAKREVIKIWNSRRTE